MKRIYYLLTLVGLLQACGNNENQFDATGNFEADDIIVSSEASGRIMQLKVDEGQAIQAQQVLGYIDTTQLYLKKQQLQFSIKAALARMPNMSKQLATVQEQIDNARHEKARFEKLLKDDAATQKQVDDLTAQLAIFERQYAALQSSLATTQQSIRSETLPLQAQIDQINDQIKKSVITSPAKGTVIVKYAEQDEVTSPGKGLFKLADISTMRLRAYISGTQLPSVKLGQRVSVLVDNQEGDYKNYDGVISWISDKAEFTPKTIQTKDERANLVYPIKIDVVNDGYIKIGMYGEVNFAAQ